MCLPRSLFIGRGQVTREGGYPYPEALDASKGQNKNKEVENLPATLPALKGPIKIKSSSACTKYRQIEKTMRRGLRLKCNRGVRAKHRTSPSGIMRESMLHYE